MKYKLLRFSLLGMLMLLGGMLTTMKAEFKDFSVIVNNQTGTLLNADELVQNTAISFGVAVDASGATVRTTDEALAVATISGTYHSDHGCTGLVVTVPVEGNVKITVGQCTFSATDIVVKNSAGATVVSKTPAKACWKNDRNNVTELYYTGDATTLTISGMGYCPYVAVEAVAVAPSKYTVTYSLGEATAQGVLPAAAEVTAGESVTIPANFTLYQEGYTLTAWTDGTANYAPGAAFTPATDVTLTPVFTANTVSLADRTEPVTVKWNFRPDQGAPKVGWQNQAGLVWVAQATVNGQTIDVALPFSTSPGKFNNTNNSDWVQINNGTTFTVPACKGATISMEAYNTITTTTIDGQTDYTQGKTISYDIAGSSETVDVVIGDGSYYRYLQVVLPVVASAGGKTFDNVAGTISWGIGNEANGTVTAEIAEAVSVSSVSFGSDLTVTTRSGMDAAPTQTFVDLQPATSNPGTGAGPRVDYYVKMAKGLTFKPTSVTYDAIKVGTDNASYHHSYRIDGTESTKTEVTKDKLVRNNNATGTPALNHTVNITSDGCQEFTFHIYVSGFAYNKNLCIGNIKINGTVSGSIVDVAKYSLTTSPNIADAGSVSVYPAAEEYETGTEVTLTATENFGFDFVNWTNADGDVLSEEAKFKYTMTADATLIANFKQVDTYELKVAIDGTSEHMVTISPEPTIVDGKNMYEAGTAVQLNANQYEGLVTFNNWSDGETSSSKLVSIDKDTEITAVYSQADIVAGWDFYTAGNSGRVADFSSEDNTTAALSLVLTSDGTTTSGWLDKSTIAANGYESFKGAAVNWRTGSSNGDVGYYHWQTKVNASQFTDLKVQFQMMYNYNAYQTYNAEYSLDGETWTNFGSISMSAAKNAASFSKGLPAACNNQANLYIRMLADKTSKVDGTASANDGNTLAMFFITGSQALVDDGTAPVLVSTVPADGAASASATGKIVLTFDEKVKVAEGITATIGSQTLTPVVSGKTVNFEYKGLEYSTEYKFHIAGGSITDLTDNAYTSDISIKFTTMTRPAVEKGLYDAVVEDATGLLAAINEANSRSDKNARYRIFLKNGTYTLPKSTTATVAGGDGNTYASPITYISASNISFIGESRDGVIITNDIPADAYYKNTSVSSGYTSVYDGIGKSDVLQLDGSVRGTYFQDLTVKSGIGDALGRNLAVQDRGSQTIYKNTGLYGYQDTWTSNNDNGLYYFEGGYVRGRTDYMCGKGDAFFNAVELRQIAGGYAAVPSNSIKYGFVYKDCVINGEAATVNSETGDTRTAKQVDGNYTLGRPWGSGTPVASFIDTKMNVVPSAIGWNEMSNGWPKQFAEWNSMTSTGATVDLSGRKKTFSDGHANNPVLTAEQAMEAGDLHNMFGEWDPTLATEQAPVPQNLQQTGATLTWTGSNYALLWAVVKDGKVVDFTTEPTYTLTATGTYAVRAANEMGGLSEASTAIAVTELAPATIAVTFNTSGYTTLASSEALDFAQVENVTAYIVTATADNVATLTAIEKAPAATGLVVKGTAGTACEIPVTTAATDDVTANLLMAAVAATTVEARSAYVLNGNEFKLFAATEIPAGKAYLPKTGSSRSLQLVIGDATGIAEISAANAAGSEVYSLSGQRTVKPAKGVYIVDGKKVVIK